MSIFCILQLPAKPASPKIFCFMLETRSFQAEKNYVHSNDPAAMSPDDIIQLQYV